MTWLQYTLCVVWLLTQNICSSECHVKSTLSKMYTKTSLLYCQCLGVHKPGLHKYLVTLGWRCKLYSIQYTEYTVIPSIKSIDIITIGNTSDESLCEVSVGCKTRYNLEYCNEILYACPI